MRVNPSLTINAGLRWDYWSPITELYGRLVNLDVAPGFADAAPVVANSSRRPVDGRLNIPIRWFIPISTNLSRASASRGVLCRHRRW